MNPKTSVALLVILMSTLSAGASPEKEGYNGVLHFRDGSSVSFEWLGSDDNLISYQVAGQRGMQSVHYKLNELKAIVFADKNKEYKGGSKGSVVVVSKSGKKFTLTKAYIHGHGTSNGYINYVYQDPVTSDLKHSSTRIKRKLSSIEIGKEKGKQKLNKRTGRYFPPFYVYDPFTGEKLTWASRK